MTSFFTQPILTASMRRYKASDCAVFCRTREKFGALSNMHNGFPLQLEDMLIGSSEALYQALRFPDHPTLQAEIIACKNAFSSKQRAYLPDALPLTRDDWLSGTNRLAMRAVLHLKMSQHRETLRFVLHEAGARPIVELSIRDPFWGAVPTQEDGEDYLVGHNELGILWDPMEHLLDKELEDWPCGMEALRLFGRSLADHTMSTRHKTISLF